MTADWRGTRLWRETCGIPESVAATLADHEGIAAVATLLGAPGVRRVVATGNGAAYYAALALWLASLEGDQGPDVQAVPAGLVARGAFRWRPGDAMLVFSSSGEMRDVIEALDAGAPGPFAAVTATPSATIGRRAGAVAKVTVRSQDAVTHTQAFCGNVTAGLAVWAELTADAGLAGMLVETPAAVERACAAAGRWVTELASHPWTAAVVFGTGPAWAGALEGALLLKEVAGIPAEGVETREGGTSAMYALGPGHVAVSLPTAADDLVVESEATCAARGATVLRCPGGDLLDRRLAPVTAFPALVALAARLGSERRLDVDRPAWTDAYYATARSQGA